MRGALVETPPHMTDRDRFVATMHYQPVDRCPICDFGFWDETIPEWHKGGLPCNVHWWSTEGEIHTDDWFGMDVYATWTSPEVGLCPAFEDKVLEDRGDHEVAQQSNGVIVLRKKYLGSIPHHMGHLLTDRDSWLKHYKPRLDPTNPDRFAAWDAARSSWADPDRQKPNSLCGGSLFGFLRDWMGLENISLVPYDDPAWFEEMVQTLADCTLAVMERTFAQGATFESCNMWEDMCYRGGPLLSPDNFKRFLVPQYRRITDLLHRHGVDVVWVDCDGMIDLLIPLWLESGVNCMFPVEVGTWKADPLRLRKEYGRDLLMMGGFDKHVLQASPDAIRTEVQRLAPLCEEGGYIPMPDHRVPPDVPYTNYLTYLREARRVWGKGVNLRPCPALDGDFHGSES